MNEEFHSQRPDAFHADFHSRVALIEQLEFLRDLALSKWWFVLLCTLLGSIYCTYRVQQMPDVYQANGALMAVPKINVTIGNVYKDELDQFAGTQLHLLKGRKLNTTVKERLADFEKSLPLPPNVQVEVFRERDASLFRLQVRSTSAEYSRRYLDLLMTEYIHYRRVMREESSESAASILLREIQHLDQDRKNAEAALFEYQRLHNVASIDAQGNAAALYLGNLKQRLASLRTELQLLGASPATAGLKGGERVLNSNLPSQDNTLSVAEINRTINRSSEVTQLKNALSLLYREQEEMARNYKPKHAARIRIDEEIGKKEELLTLLMEENEVKLQSHRLSLLNEAKTLEASIADWERQTLESNRMISEYGFLKAESVRIQELYDILVKRLKEIDLGNNMQQENIAIQEGATLMVGAVAPHRVKEILLGTLAGFAVAILLIYLQEKFHHRIQSLMELRHLIGSDRILGQVPQLRRMASGQALLAVDSTLNEVHQGLMDRIWVKLSQNAPEQKRKTVSILNQYLGTDRNLDLAIFAESIRKIRSGLMLSTHGIKTIALASPLANEGKTTMACNLALSFSEIPSCRVLIMDLDLRKMSVHKHFNMENQMGVTDVLQGRCPLEECLYATRFSNLHILCGGSTVQNAGDLLLSNEFPEVLKRLSGWYDKIIIDTSPLLLTHDALSMASVVDGVILTMRAKRTPVRLFKEAMETTLSRSKNFLGVILNGVEPGSALYYYYYHSHSYYGGLIHDPETGRKKERVVHS